MYRIGVEGGELAAGLQLCFYQPQHGSATRKCSVTLASLWHCTICCISLCACLQALGYTSLVVVSLWQIAGVHMAALVVSAATAS